MPYYLRLLPTSSLLCSWDFHPPTPYIEERRPKRYNLGTDSHPQENQAWKIISALGSQIKRNVGKISIKAVDYPIDCSIVLNTILTHQGYQGLDKSPILAACSELQKIKPKTSSTAKGVSSTWQTPRHGWRPGLCLRGEGRGEAQVAHVS